MNDLAFRTEIRMGRAGVAFGTGSWCALDHLGLMDPDHTEKAVSDRPIWSSARDRLKRAAGLARTIQPGAYGSKESARRRQFCDRVASIANGLEATP